VCDKIVVLDEPVYVVNNYLRGEVDTANRSPWHHEIQLRDKCCTVSSPIGLYVDLELKDVFHPALCEVAEDLVFPLSHCPTSLLAMETLRKCNWYVVKRTLDRAGIRHAHILCYGQKSSVDFYHWLEAIPGPRQVWIDFGYRIHHTVPGNVLLMQLSRDPNPGLGFSDGRFSVNPMFADISALHQQQGDTCPFGSVWWEGLNRHEHIDQMKFYPQFVHVLKAYAPSSMMTMPKNQRMCQTRLTQLNIFQIDIQDLHQLMPVWSVRAKVTMHFTLMDQLRMAI